MCRICGPALLRQVFIWLSAISIVLLLETFSSGGRFLVYAAYWSTLAAYLYGWFAYRQFGVSDGMPWLFRMASMFGILLGSQLLEVILFRRYFGLHTLFSAYNLVNLTAMTALAAARIPASVWLSPLVSAGAEAAGAKARLLSLIPTEWRHKIMTRFNWEEIIEEQKWSIWIVINLPVWLICLFALQRYGSRHWLLASIGTVVVMRIGRDTWPKEKT
jgi:hypothetical protein